MGMRGAGRRGSRHRFGERKRENRGSGHVVLRVARLVVMLVKRESRMMAPICAAFCNSVMADRCVEAANSYGCSSNMAEL